MTHAQESVRVTVVDAKLKDYLHDQGKKRLPKQNITIKKKMGK